MNWYGRSLASGCLVALAGMALLSAPAQAQTYPTRSITMIVPFAAGGPTDVIARIVTGHMAQTLGQAIIIENVVGAGGTTATTRAARAANDGYTLITGHMGTHAASVPLYPKLAYHPEKDFEPVGLLAGTPILILARKDLAPKDLKEFIAYVKANETKVNAGHAGIGSVSNFSKTYLSWPALRWGATMYDRNMPRPRPSMQALMALSISLHIMMLAIGMVTCRLPTRKCHSLRGTRPTLAGRRGGAGTACLRTRRGVRDPPGSPRATNP